MKKYITITDLRKLVKELNEEMTTNKNVVLVVSGAYGGYQVQLTGKYEEVSKTWASRLHSGATEITNGFCSARETISRLESAYRSGKIQQKINLWN